MPRVFALLLLAVVQASLFAQITVAFPPDVSPKPIDGRILLLLSSDPSQEPRMQINDSPDSQLVFGKTVDGMVPNQPVTITDQADGSECLSDLPPR